MRLNSSTWSCTCILAVGSGVFAFGCGSDPTVIAPPGPTWQNDLICASAACFDPLDPNDPGGELGEPLSCADAVKPPAASCLAEGGRFAEWALADLAAKGTDRGQRWDLVTSDVETECANISETQKRVVERTPFTAWINPAAIMASGANAGDGFEPFESDLGGCREVNAEQAGFDWALPGTLTLCAGDAPIPSAPLQDRVSGGSRLRIRYPISDRLQAVRTRNTLDHTDPDYDEQLARCQRSGAWLGLESTPFSNGTPLSPPELLVVAPSGDGDGCLYLQGQGMLEGTGGAGWWSLAFDLLVDVKSTSTQTVALPHCDGTTTMLAVTVPTLAGRFIDSADKMASVVDFSAICGIDEDVEFSTPSDLGAYCDSLQEWFLEGFANGFHNGLDGRLDRAGNPICYEGENVTGMQKIEQTLQGLLARALVAQGWGQGDAMSWSARTLDKERGITLEGVRSVTVDSDGQCP